ncbi:MAG: hypothetical protein KDA53_05355 [Hyphomonas sp.]|nr:hypothetical protein [Hyphomonas sp.]
MAGVFLGVQLGNWNTARQEQAAYRDALDRYRAEIVTNLDTLDTVDAESATRLEIVGRAFDALLSCDDSAEARQLVETGLLGIIGTSGLTLRSSALDELTGTQTLLSRQPEALRLRLADTRYYMTAFLREAAYIETIPLEERMQNNPIVRIGATHSESGDYMGQDYSRPQRNLELAVPVSEACTDNMLIKSFYTWERWQLAIPAVTRVLRTRLQDDLDMLGGPPGG